MDEFLTSLGAELTPYIINFIVVLVGILFTYLGKKAGKLFDELADNKRVKTVVELGHKHKEIVQSAVEFAEQVGKKLQIHGEEKFELAKKTAIESARKEGIDLSTADLDMLIESAVNSFNKGFKDIKAQKVTTAELRVEEAPFEDPENQ